MVFKRLEERIGEEHIEDYLDISEALKEPTKTVFRYLLDITTSIENVNLENEYTIFGGYAVLTHLIDQYGDKIVKMWRGSSDIDIAGSVNILNLLRAFYKVESDMLSPNVPDKRTVKLKLPNEDLCKIDFTSDEEQEKYQRESKSILGIPINVSSPYALIKYKLIPAETEANHRVDIMKLLGVLENRDNSPEILTQYLTQEERKALRNVIRLTQGRLSNERMTTEPSKQYLSQLKHLLHSYSLK